MRKRTIKVCSLVLIMLMVMSNVTFANGKEVDNILSSKDVNTSVQPRSLYLASGISEVTNQGEGYYPFMLILPHIGQLIGRA